MIITIDGPAGTGKSTVAKQVASLLGFTYFDTGAMFRSIALGVIEHSVDPTNEEAISNLLKKHPISLQNGHFFLGTKDVTSELRRPEVSNMASKISTHKAVRDYLARIQRELGEHQDSVFEGRDMGTVIFPNAQVKVFLTASPEVRAERRFLELQAKGNTQPYMEVLQEIKDRDERDSKRSIAPLKPAADAHIIDTSHLSIDQVIEQIIALCKESFKDIQ